LSDKKYLDWKEARNDLEGYSYKIRNQLSDGCPWVPFIDETLRQPLLDEVNTCVDWLYEDGETAPLLEYHQKLSKFKNLVEPVKERAIFFEMIPEVYKQFEQFKVKILTQAAEVAHLTADQRKAVFDKVELTQAYYDGIKKELSTQPLFKNVSQTLD